MGESFPTIEEPITVTLGSSSDLANTTTLDTVNIEVSNPETGVKAIRRRATFSIAPFDPNHTRQIITAVPDDEPILDSKYALWDRNSRKDSAIDLGSDTDDESPDPFRQILQAALFEKSKLSNTTLVNDVEPHVQTADELLQLEEDKSELQQAMVEASESEGIISIQSGMDQIASVFLPKELKSLTIQPGEEEIAPVEIKRNSDIVVCVVGVGYVGEHLLSAFGSVFNAIGFDVSQKRLDFIAPDFKGLPKVELTSDATQLARGTHYLISVPTNLHKDNTVNATHLLTAISTVTTYARPGSVVVIESSVSVGMTRSFLTQYSENLYCGMSPERVDPGRISPSLVEIPKVISGLDETSLIKIKEIYSQVFDHVVAVSRPEVAEMTKLYENCYRMVNIAYVNEIADACVRHGLDPNEVIDAAATKPFGFQAFRPGLGVGGHCIPINPHYLAVNNSLPVLEYATAQVAGRPAKLARELFDSRAPFAKSRKGLRVLVIGVAFKPGQNVISCSPGLSFAAAMSDLGCKSLNYYDPFVPQEDAPFMSRLSKEKFNKKYIDAHFDVVAVCMKQHDVDFRVLDQLKTTFVKRF